VQGLEKASNAKRGSSRLRDREASDHCSFMCRTIYTLATWASMKPTILAGVTETGRGLRSRMVNHSMHENSERDNTTRTV
jgi:hypothetical protein